MKVNIDQTLEVSDEQRKAIAAKIDGPGAKKRDATRDEMKTFIWGQGSQWADYLLEGDAEPDEDLVGDPGPDPDEDLIGGDDDLESLI